MIKTNKIYILATFLLAACTHTPQKPADTELFGKFVSLKTSDKTMISALSEQHRETYKEMLELYIEITNSDIAALDENNAYLVGSDTDGRQQIMFTSVDNYLGSSNIKDWEVLVTEEELSDYFQKPMLIDYAAPAQGSNKILVFSTVGGSDYNFIFEYDLECGLDCPNLFLKDSKSLSRIRYLDNDTILYLDSKEGVTNTSDRYGGALYKWERGKGDTLIYQLPEGAYYLSSWLYSIDGASYPAFSYFKDSKYHTFLSHNRKVIDTLPSGRMKYSNGQLFFELSASNAKEVAGKSKGYVYSVSAEKALSGEPIKPEDVKSYDLFETDLPYSDYAVTDKYIYTLHSNQEKAALFAIDNNTGKPVSNAPIVYTENFTSVALYNIGDLKDRIFIFESGFHEPRRISYLYDEDELGTQKTLYRMERFNLPLSTDYHEARSHDGELVPYYVVSLEGSTSKAPTMVYTYGGFGYNNYPGFGVAYYQWLKHGGKIVFPMVRGGKENGAKWHEDAKGLNKKNTFYDLYAVLEDIYANDISEPGSTNLLGVSNGAVTAFSTIGLYNVEVNKIAVSNPLADMVNFDQFGNGSNWVSEYGDPKDPEIRKYLKSYSPVENIYQNKKLPSSLIVYSEFDDRTPSIHPKRLYEQLSNQNIDELYLYDIGIGGHNTSLSTSKKAELYSLVVEFFLLKDQKSQ